MTAMRRPDRVLGPGHDEFWEWCGKGELRLPRCTRCGHLAWPPVPACEACGGSEFSWERMSGDGTLASWCTFERGYYAKLLPIPWETILVELAEGPLFISNPVGFGWPDCRMGMPLKLQFLDCEDRAGLFSLPVFAAA